MKIVLSGASGYLGQHLTQFFSERGDEVVVISRHQPTLPKNARFLEWDGQNQGEWSRELDGADAVINLAGRSVNCRYTPENKREIFDSRLDSTSAIGRAISNAKNPPKVWLNAASATIYRDARDRAMDEETGEIGSGFSVEVCQQWEKTLFEAQTPQTRKTALRLAMVFGPKGPVLEAFTRLVKVGLGGAHAGGGQYMSWIHLQDFTRAIAFLMENELSGPVNVCAPHPLKNREFLRALRQAYHRPFGIPAPKIGLEIGARILGTETELLLKSRRVVPKRLLDAGFRFDFPDWPRAAHALAQAERDAN